MVRPAIAALLISVLIAAEVRIYAQGPADLQSSIAALSSLDYLTRMNAARTIRRLPATDAVPALVAAVEKHRDEFVRFRAFIVLSSFGDRGTGELVRSLLRDANDRLREVAYKWLEAHPAADDVIWLQEEPRNMGAWAFMRPRLEEIISDRQALRYVGRSLSASPATGSYTIHQLEQQQLLSEALG